MKIVKFHKKFVVQMTRLHKESYSKPGKKWSLSASKKALKVCYIYFPDHCFMSINNKGVCMGAISCIVNPYLKGNALIVLSIQVEKNYREKGIAKALIKKAVEISKQKNLCGVILNTCNNNSFPKSWYEKLGFKKTGMIEYFADVNNINF